ncbi:hypothetical protein ScPMuIL_010741 [Solemya velum]
MAERNPMSMAASDVPSTPSDVSDMFQKMGAKLGWFDFKDLDSALKSLSKSSKKKSTKSRVNKSKKYDREKDKENVANMGGGKRHINTLSYNTYEEQRLEDIASPINNKMRNCKPLTETCEESNPVCSNTNPGITPNQKANKLQLQMTPGIKNSRGYKTQKVSSPLTKDHTKTSNRESWEENIVSVPAECSKSNNSFLSKSDNSIARRSSFLDYLTEDIGIPAGESTRIHSRASVSRILSVTDLCEGSIHCMSNTSLRGFDESENDSYKMLNIEKATDKPTIPSRDNQKKIKNELVENGSVETKLQSRNNSLSTENSSDNENLFLTCLSSQNSTSSTCSLTGEKINQAEQNTSINSLSSYEVVDVSTQMPSLSDGSPHARSLFLGGDLKREQESIVFVSNESDSNSQILSPSDDLTRMLTGIGIQTKDGNTISDPVVGCLSESSNGSLPDLNDNLNSSSQAVQTEKTTSHSVIASELFQVVNKEAKVNSRDMSQKWRSPKKLNDKSSDDDLETFFNKMRTPMVTKEHVSDEDSLEDFIVDDDDTDNNSSQSEDGTLFYIKTTREITVSAKDKKNRKELSGKHHKRVVSFSSDDSEEEFYEGQSEPTVASSSKPTVPTRSKTTVPTRSKTTVPTSSRSVPVNVSTLNKDEEKPLTLDFLRSLSVTVPKEKSDPEANRFKKTFRKTKEELTKKLFDLYNLTVFDKQLPKDLPIIWNTRLLKTAGYCAYKKGRSERTVRVELSSKVCDSTERVRDTLIHELCHAAVWLLNGTRDGHGPYWKYWARRANQTHRELPIIERCHNYAINTRFTYKCSKCGYSIGRHSKSLDTTKKVCGHCRGHFILIDNKAGNFSAGGVENTQTPRTPNKFALFVKDNYGEVKRSARNVSHAECMKILSRQFAQNKISD